MDFELTDDQLELQQVVRDIVAKECPTTLVRAIIGGDDDDALWKTFVGLDWPGLAVGVEDGGTGLTEVELVITLEELGWVADPTPFLGTVGLYVPLVQACATGPTRSELLQAVVAGGTGTVAFAAESVRATRSGDTGAMWSLSGTARSVVDGDRADRLAVVATTDAGPAVFVVPGADVTATRLTAMDPALHLADVVLDGVTVPADQVLGADADGIERAWQVAVIALSAEMVGASRRVLDLVLGHVRERQQFGVPIGSFQAVKHMAVDMYVAIERARVLVHFAELAIAEDDERRALAASMAKVAAGECQRLVVKHGIQLFGGLGFTWENDLHLFARRAKVGDVLLGTTAWHRARVARTTFASLPPFPTPETSAPGGVVR